MFRSVLKLFILKNTEVPDFEAATFGHSPLAMQSPRLSFVDGQGVSGHSKLG